MEAAGVYSYRFNVDLGKRRKAKSLGTGIMGVSYRRRP